MTEQIHGLLSPNGSRSRPQLQKARSASPTRRDGHIIQNVPYEQQINFDDCVSFSTHQDTIDVSNQIQTVSEKVLDIEDKIKMLETEQQNKTEFENKLLEYNNKIESLYEDVRVIKAEVEQLKAEFLKVKNKADDKVENLLQKLDAQEKELHILRMKGKKIDLREVCRLPTYINKMFFQPTKKDGNIAVPFKVFLENIGRLQGEKKISADKRLDDVLQRLELKRDELIEYDVHYKSLIDRYDFHLTAHPELTIDDQQKLEEYIGQFVSECDRDFFRLAIKKYFKFKEIVDDHQEKLVLNWLLYDIPVLICKILFPYQNITLRKQIGKYKQLRDKIDHEKNPIHLLKELSSIEEFIGWNVDISNNIDRLKDEMNLTVADITITTPDEQQVHLCIHTHVDEENAAFFLDMWEMRKKLTFLSL